MPESDTDQGRDADGSHSGPRDEADAIEISRLDEGSAPGARPDAGEPVADGSGSPVSSFAPRMRPRRRLLAMVTAGGAVLLALLVALGGVSGATLGAIGTRLGFATPTPTATLAPGARTVLFAHPVPWGTLAIDSHPVPLSATGVTFDGAPAVTLPRGAHTLEYAAAPFPTLHCHLSVPSAESDTCPLAADTLSQAIEVVSNFPSLRVIDLQAIPDHLPPAQYAALVQAVQTALVVPDGQVKPGDHFQSRSGATATASQPLTARLQLTMLGPGAGITNSIGESCDPLCVRATAILQDSASWHLMAYITAGWQFADASGALVDATPGSPGIYVFPVLLLSIDIAAWWAGTWSTGQKDTLASQLGDQICQSGESQITQLLTQANFGQGHLLEQRVSGAQPSDGCLIRLTTASNATPAAPGAYTVFARYGALVAADAPTQHALPQLPHPSANERTLIAQLASPPNSSVLTLPVYQALSIFE